MNTGSDYEKNVFGGRLTWSRCSIRRQSFRKTHPSKTSDFLQVSRNALTTAGVKTVGEIRVASDAMLLSLQYLGKGSVAHLRETLGLPSTDGVRPVGLGLKSKAPNGKEAWNRSV